MSDDDAPPLSVRRYGIGVFLVRSQRKSCEDWYLATFEEEGFPKGICACRHFEHRIEPKVRRGIRPRKPTCLHLDALARELAKAKRLCRRASLPFHERLIPMHR